MLHGTFITTTDALILPAGSHWYKFDNKPAYFHDLSPLQICKELAVPHLRCSTFCADYIFNFGHELAVQNFAEIG